MASSDLFGSGDVYRFEVIHKHPQGHALTDGISFAIMFFRPSVTRSGQAPPSWLHQGDRTHAGGVRLGGASDVFVGWKVGGRGRIISFHFHHRSVQGLAAGKDSSLKNHSRLKPVGSSERGHLDSFADGSVPSLLRLHV